MEQHPIPQQISSYQFKLVGDMTLKQFFQVAGGIVVSLLFYATPLHPIIKWPIIVLSAALGAAMAFLPFQERPLEKWIIAFFRSIYSPTLYTWKKTEKPAVFFTENAQVPAIGNVPAGQTAIEPNAKKLEEAEKSFLAKLGSLWSISSPSAKTQQPPSTTVQPPVQVAVLQTDVTKPVAPKPQPTKPNLVAIPQQIPTVITRSTPRLVVEEHGPAVTNNLTVSSLDVPKLEEKKITTNEAEFSIDAAPPQPAIVANTVVGQVMDQERKIIEGAILEIKDLNGRPVRALKSNKAGHFIIVTPLANGKYEISIEKEGFTFDPVSFETNGEIIPPIAIKGKKI
ncbi:MAG TPA: PrgI family protein [Patescibacteria group bacterium]|nr:PrgI family protein [Patescibacteria group bacterium]